jgi:Bacteriophage Lambda NinG protein.
MKHTSKNTLDRVFSEYIRRRDADENGLIRCISCGKIVPWKESDCGHYINRKHNSTRYDEKNCNAQCRSCNRFDEGNIQGYRKGLIAKYGEKATELLEIKKRNICRLGQFEINVLADEYRGKLKQLKP